jgi:hypothetical protein
MTNKTVGNIHCVAFWEQPIEELATGKYANNLNNPAY